ncbi:MAG: hypothetical protein EBZ76_00935 [Synechococcaceae bacterium WB9_2_170]|jgi:hypothetical protein|nr:hypothetical protein [Synechococcaceae bacterium WB9_2_170]
MASLQWHHSCQMVIDSQAIGKALGDLGFSIANSDLESGYIFALADANKKMAGESLSILISWSPVRLDGYLVEVRSKEPALSNKRSRAEQISELLKKSLVKLLCRP